MINRKLFSIALVTALAAGLPALASADIPSQRDIDIHSVLGDNSQRIGTTELEAPEFAGSGQGEGREVRRVKLDLGDPRDDRFQGPGYQTP